MSETEIEKKIVECSFCKSGFACVLAPEHWPTTEVLRKCGVKPCRYELGQFFRFVPRKRHDWELMIDDPETGVTCYVCKGCGDQSLSQDREEYDEEGCTPKDGGEPKCEKCGTEIFSEDDGFCQICYDREHPGG